MSQRRALVNPDGTVVRDEDGHPQFVSIGDYEEEQQRIADEQAAQERAAAEAAAEPPAPAPAPAPPAAPVPPNTPHRSRSLAEIEAQVRGTPPPAQSAQGPGYWAAVGVALILGSVAVAVVLRSFVFAPTALPTGAARSTEVAVAPAPVVGAAATSAPRFPTPTPRPTLPPGLAVYFGPDGAAAPALVVATSAYTATATYQGWVKLEINGYAVPVWARRDALPQLDVAGLPAPYQPTPTPEPVVIVRQVQLPAPPPVILDCTRDRATFTAARNSAYGTTEAWSCESQAQADARADQQIAEINRKAGH